MKFLAGCAVKDFGDAVILCGGKSRRMGFDKSFAKIDGRYMIEAIRERLSVCFENIRLCADSSEKFSVFGLEVIEDTIKGRIGPAAAIYSALLQATSKYVFVVACDMPLVNPEHIESMKRVLQDNAFVPDALVPMNGEHIEPLYGFYSTGIAEKFLKEMENGNHKILNILKKCNTLYLEEEASRKFDKDLAIFTNINYAQDLEKISWLMKLK